ncbi:MAG: hypothetical protein A3I66_16455 [Burkholderiales bacterium RIFCSPLOWO2_02_FULL_57_36]|nr:MAG: hypothetical protein A3I66_16455 [Burkholderiales bacterium RIFCSPLOWO2_02_FULL_57_36]
MGPVSTEAAYCTGIAVNGIAVIGARKRQATSCIVVLDLPMVASARIDRVAARRLLMPGIVRTTRAVVAWLCRGCLILRYGCNIPALLYIFEILLANRTNFQAKILDVTNPVLLTSICT